MRRPNRVFYFARSLKVQPQWLPSVFVFRNLRVNRQGQRKERTNLRIWDAHTAPTHSTVHTMLRRSFSIKTNVNFSGMWKDFISLGLKTRPSTHTHTSDCELIWQFRSLRLRDYSCSVVCSRLPLCLSIVSCHAYHMSFWLHSDLERIPHYAGTQIRHGSSGY